MDQDAGRIDGSTTVSSPGKPDSCRNTDFGFPLIPWAGMKDSQVALLLKQPRLDFEDKSSDVQKTCGYIVDFIFAFMVGLYPGLPRIADEVGTVTVPFIQATESNRWPFFMPESFIIIP